MGALRGGLLILVSIALFFSLFVAGLFLTISLSLDYDNVREELIPVLKDSSKSPVKISDTISKDYTVMEEYCGSYSNYVVNYEGERVVIPCSVISQGKEAVIDYGIDQFVQEVYFGNYDCSFVGCFAEYEIPFFVVSKKMQGDFLTNFGLFLIVIAILSILGFLASEKKSNFFILLSMLLVLSALPFLKFDWFINLAGGSLQGLLSVFFNKSFLVFKSVAILGAVLLFIGLVSKFFRIGFDVSTIFSKRKPEKKSKKK